MSNKSRAKNKLRRKAERNKLKAARRALYASYAASGNNSKRSKIKAGKARKVRLSRHRLGRCGNVGCERCFPENARPRMNAPHPRIGLRVAA